jgi:hypothetical protein
LRAALIRRPLLPRNLAAPAQKGQGVKMSAFQSQCLIYDPWKVDGKTNVTVSNEKAARDMALTALFELRGKMRVKTTMGGAMELAKSGLESKPHPTPENVAIIHRVGGEVRYLNLAANEKGLDIIGGAVNRMTEMLVGQWRFASEVEIKTAQEKNALALKTIREMRAQEVEGPANRAMERLTEIVGAAVDFKKGKPQHDK